MPAIATLKIVSEYDAHECSSDARDNAEALATGLWSRLQGKPTVGHVGRVVRAVGTTIRVSGIPARIGQRCEIADRAGGVRLLADVVGVDRGDALLVPLDRLHGVAADAEVRVVSDSAKVAVGPELLGRVLDGFGRAMDDLPTLLALTERPLVSAVPRPLNRQRIVAAMATGVKAIDTVLTVGIGQRVGVFAAAGAGKSTLLGMLATHADVDIIVIGLVGERGREVREFLEDCLDGQSRGRSVVIVATSDRPAAERLACAHTATAVAESFREQGKQVLLLIDSVTRFARAAREIGLSMGEPPVRQGFTPSVFVELPRLFERAGTDAVGAITAFYTVLTDDDDAADPIAEETRSILDGHIVLSRSLGEAGHYPAIDSLGSVSRLARQLQTPTQRQLVQQLRQLLAQYRESEFLIQIGEYKPNTDPLIDAAIEARPALQAFLQQVPEEGVDPQEAWSTLSTLLQPFSAVFTSSSVPGVIPDMQAGSGP